MVRRHVAAKHIQGNPIISVTEAMLRIHRQFTTSNFEAQAWLALTPYIFSFNNEFIGLSQWPSSFSQEHAPTAKPWTKPASRSLDPEARDTASGDGDLTSVFQEGYRALPRDELESVLISVYDCPTTSQAEADFLERSTRKQLRSEAWRPHGRGRTTASNLGGVRGAMQESSSPTLLITYAT